MLTDFMDIMQANGITPEMLALGGLALGLFIGVSGLASLFAGQDPESRRMNAATAAATGGSFDLIRGHDRDPRGLLKAFVPKSRKERTVIAAKLRQGGIHSQSAVRNYFLVKTLFGLCLPVLFLGLAFISSTIILPLGLDGFFRGLSWLQTLQSLVLLIVVGFYGPSVWLKAKIRRRKKEIELGLPNALDLLQVSIQAGLGLDAGMARIAEELMLATPSIAEEFTILQLEIHAGKERDKAFLEMAERTGVPEMFSFANVVLQASQFGTSVSEALSTYSDEMRLNRELRAQEKANKLPVKMSAVMAALMMPTLLMITLFPVIIRWMSTMV